MRLSTRSRYGTRMMIDLATHYSDGPVQMKDISIRQNVSVKYLEQLVIPLKKAKFIKSVRGPKGGHMLTRSPNKIRVGDIVRVLESQSCLVNCMENPALCGNFKACPTRKMWDMATQAVYDKLNSFTLLEMAQKPSKSPGLRSGADIP
jgi:Rrf2 family iron-sulfur cluster assembly transcriptional regulator